ncbi:hypothetical protein B296_00018602 [Ensete ventricosum]|uniref:Josephin-like protein n=1 Tax=Ensete ventricosum TaxID=4639 RepID=A0A427APZ5_ENSVE|nr:hypothetical protein B296_00018602 [Ensete ventricosum]
MSRCPPVVVPYFCSPGSRTLQCDRRMAFRPDNVSEKPTISLTSTIHSRDSKEKHSRWRGFPFRLLRSARVSAVRFFRLLDTQTSSALHRISRTRRQPPSNVYTDMTPQRFAPPGDSHLSEALEDCIKFLNSSSRRSC